MTDRKLNPEYVAAVKRLVNHSPYFSLLSMRIEHLTWGASFLEIDLGDKHLQPFGMVHGGVFASILDAAAFWAVFPQLEGETGLTTVEIKVNYLAPAREGRLQARGNSIKMGKTLVLGEAQVNDHEGRLLAHGTATMMCLAQLHMKGHESLPPKVV